MIETRLARLRERMQEFDLDALLVSDVSNIRYYSAYTNRDAVLLLTAGGENLLLTDSRYDEQARAECPLFEVSLIAQGRDGMAESIANHCKERRLKRFGFSPSLRYRMYAALQERLPETKLLPADGLAEAQRMVKDEQERALLKQACVATDQVFSALCSYIKAGLNEREIEWQLLTLTREIGCSPSFPPIVVSGGRGSLPHGEASEKKLEEGDFVTMDFGCRFEGYCADMTRTVHIGTPGREQETLYHTVLEANLLGIASVKSGIPASQPDRIVRNYLREQGYGAYFSHGLGHGIGLDVHEAPSLNMATETELQEGCFVTVEPGVYLPGKVGIRIEDTVMVTEQGCEVLFSSTKELLCF